jgi:NIMA-interacting peptidyl-prolyl cis-trans isomerase 1
LGFFGPKKMQPAFEEASFALKIGELSGIAETSSGVHVLLRIG